MSLSKYYHINKSGKLIIINSVEEALSLRNTEGYIWLSFCQPTFEELSLLTEPLGLHPLSIEDCLDDNQVPKIDDFPENTFILFNAFRFVDKKIVIDEINFFIGKNFLISVNRRLPDEQQLFNGIENQLLKDGENIKLGPDFLLHILMDSIVDQKFIAIEQHECELDAAEEILLTNLSEFCLSDLQLFRRDLLSLRKSLFNEREILIKVCRKDSKYISEKSIYHFRDIYDHLAKFLELTESYREIVSSLMEMYLNMLNNQLAKSANQTNLIVRRLTLITTIFMPLSLLAGIGGMSEWSMMTGSQNWKISYTAFILGMVVIGTINYFILMWFEKKDRRID